MPTVLPVIYYVGPGVREGGYVYVFEAVGPAAAHLNANAGGIAMWGTGEIPVRARYFAGEGFYFFHDDCHRAARQFEDREGVRTRVLCLPMPVKFGYAWFHKGILQKRAHWTRRHAVIVRWMIAARFPVEVAENIALHLLGNHPGPYYMKTPFQTTLITD